MKEAEIGVIQPQGKECQRLPVAARGQEREDMVQMKEFILESRIDSALYKYLLHARYYVSVDARDTDTESPVPI